jgi:hypothetical protein
VKEENNKRPKFFHIPKFAWIILGLWWVLHIAIVLAVGINAEVLGRLTVDLFLPLAAPWVLTLPAWLLTRRSQRAASVTFSIILLLIVLSQLAFRVSQVATPGAPNKEAVTNRTSGGYQ